MENSDDQKAEMDAPLPIFKRPKDDKEDDDSNPESSQLSISELQAPKSADNESEKVDSLFLSLSVECTYSMTLTFFTYCGTLKLDN